MTALLVIAGAVLALDQITKSVVLDRLAPGIVIAVVDDLVNLTLVRNPGLAFGVLASVPGRWRWLVAALSLGALVVLGRLAVGTLRTAGWLSRLYLRLTFRGAVGNQHDRAAWSSVGRLAIVNWHR